MPIEVPGVDATVTGTASLGQGFLEAENAVKAAASRITFDGLQLANGSEGVVLEMVLLFKKVPGPGNVLNLTVRADSGLSAAEAAQQVDGRIINLRATIAETKLLDDAEYTVKAAGPPQATPAPVTP